MKSNMKKIPLSSSSAPMKRNFKISDDDESCVGDMLDPCGQCVTKGQLRDGTLVNRLLMCCFSVVLLWASSFSTAVYITNSVVSSPQFASVRDSCDATYQQAQRQKQEYTTCVDRQMEECDTSFATELNKMVKHTNEQLEANADILDNVAGYQEACMSSFNTAQAAISEWITTGADYRLYYTCPYGTVINPEGPTNPYCNATCGYEEEAAKNVQVAGGGDGRGFQSCSCAEVADMVGDMGSLRASLRAESFAMATDYSEYSQGVVDHMVTYTLARSKYDREYAVTKAEPVRKKFVKALEYFNWKFIAEMTQHYDLLAIRANYLIDCAILMDEDDDEERYCAEYYWSMTRIFERVQAIAQGRIDFAIREYNRMKENMTDMMASVAASFKKFKEFYNGVFKDLKKMWMSCCRFIAFDDDLPWVQTSLGMFDTYYFPYLGEISPPWFDQKDVTWLYQDMHERFDLFMDALNLSELDVRARAIALDKAIDEFTRSFDFLNTKDYDPPQYGQFAPVKSGAKTEEQAQEEFGEKSTEFEYTTASSLQAFSELNELFGDDAELSSWSYNLSYASGDDDLTFSGLNFKFESLTPNTVDWDLLYIGIRALFNLGFAFDFTYRIYKTFCYIHKFWSRAGLEIPEVDIRQDKTTFSISGGSEDNDSSSGGEGCASCIMCILCPCWSVLFCLFLAVFVILNFVLLYIPVINEYSKVCVNHQGNGTFLTGNIYSVAFNYAAEAGNEDLIDGLEAYNTRMADYCGAYTTFTKEQQAEDELLLAELSESHRRTRNAIFMMDQCVNLTMMDGLFERACCGDYGGLYGDLNCTHFKDSSDPQWYSEGIELECPRNVNGVPYPPLSKLVDVNSAKLHELKDQEEKDKFEANRRSSTQSRMKNTYGNNFNVAKCLENPYEWKIEDSSFFCSELPQCEVTCNGPNKELLQESSEQCGCMAEWMMHTWWVQILGAMLVYAVLNASRSVVISGVVRLCWKWMSPNLFTYSATATLDGYYLAPLSASKFPSFKSMLHSELGNEMASYERLGWSLVIGGLAMNILWVYFFMLFNDDNLYYDANES